MSEEKCWYVVHTQTGHEDKVREKILLNVDSQNFGDRIFNVLVPTEEVVEVKQNKKILRKRKFFPGYVLVQMLLTSEAYWFIRNISGVTGFLIWVLLFAVSTAVLAIAICCTWPLRKVVSAILRTFVQLSDAG